MKRLMILPLLLLAAFAQAASLRGAAVCTLQSAPADAPEWQTQAFPLLLTSEGYRAARSMASSFFDLTKIDPSELEGWPSYGGTYYKGGDDLWVILTAGEAGLPEGISHQVVKPLERDVNTNERPAVYICRKTL